MRKLFILSTSVFWLAVAAFWLADIQLQQVPNAINTHPQTADPVDKLYMLLEVAKHDNKDDCWMAIEGGVYDISAYLPSHPSDPDLILPWCGKEASQAWQTKSRALPHSSRAQKLLMKYRIGQLQPSR